MSNEKQSFLKRKNVIISFKRYGIDAMGSMALGLFASLLIGTIINTIGQNVCPGSFVSEKLLEIGGYATSVTGAAMALAIGHALQAPPLVMYSLCAVGAACNAIGGSGGPLAVFFVAVITCEIGKLVSKETKIDIIVTPAVTVIVGVALAMLLAPVCKSVCDALGSFIGWATDLKTVLDGDHRIGSSWSCPDTSDQFGCDLCRNRHQRRGSPRRYCGWQRDNGSLERTGTGRRSSNCRMLCTYARFCDLELSR